MNVEYYKKLKSPNYDELLLLQVINSNSDKNEIDLLRIMTNDSFCSVREYAAKDENTPSNCLLKLASDECFSVVILVAKNKSATKEVIHKLINNNLVTGNLRKELYMSIIYCHTGKLDNMLCKTLASHSPSVRRELERILKMYRTDEVDSLLSIL